MVTCGEDGIVQQYQNTKGFVRPKTNKTLDLVVVVALVIGLTNILRKGLQTIEIISLTSIRVNGILYL